MRLTFWTTSNLVAISVALSGCQALEYSSSKPVIQRTVNSDGTDVIALTAERRLVYSQARDSKRLVCSEPPPDVAQAFADSVRVALQLAAEQQASNSRTAQFPSRSASAPGQISENGSTNEGVRGDATLNLAREFSTSISQIYTRSQGVQLFRDGAFMLCQAHLNEALRGDDLKKQVELANATIELAGNIHKRNNASGEIGTSSIDTAKGLLRNTQTESGLNYSENFNRLLDTVHSVLIKELPNLYRYDVELAKKSAEQSAAKAKTSETNAASNAEGARNAETQAEAHRNRAAQSATSAAIASDEAKKSAELAKASAASAGKN